MREIIFRAKAVKTGHFVSGNLIQNDDNSRAWILEKNDCPFNTLGYGNILSALHEVDIETICQYTGFNDSFGNMLFERDQVKITFYDFHQKELSYEIRHIIYSYSGFQFFDGDELFFELANMLTGDEAIRHINNVLVSTYQFTDHWFVVEVIDKKAHK